MIDKVKLKKAALQWMEDLNQRNLEKLMQHYADGVEFYSPTVITRWQVSEGKLVGKAAVERHFRKAIEEVPGMRFEFSAILFGVESVIIFYKRETGVLAADLVFFDDTGKVKEVRAYYGEK
jgi:SnoaL-like domain